MFILEVVVFIIFVVVGVSFLMLASACGNDSTELREVHLGLLICGGLAICFLFVVSLYSLNRIREISIDVQKLQQGIETTSLPADAKSSPDKAGQIGGHKDGIPSETEDYFTGTIQTRDGVIVYKDGTIVSVTIPEQ